MISDKAIGLFIHHPTTLTSAGFSTYALAHVKSQPIAAIAPDRGEAAAAFGIFRVGIDRQGNDDRFISGMSARRQFADRCQAP